jgi:hypothetical protein
MASRHRFARVALYLLLISSRLVPVPADAGPPRPAGVYALSAGGAELPQAILDDPRLAGVTVRWRWQSVEIQEGEYDWTYFDEQIARVAAAGKSVFLKITAGGLNVPPFLMAHVATFSFLDPSPYTPLEGVLTIPVFWDQVFLARKMALIEAMGRRFAAHPTVRLVGVSCANAKTDDWNVPHTGADVERWRAAGYASWKLIAACKQTIAATMRAFPHQHVVLAVASNGPLDRTPNYVSRTVIDWALQRYPDRFLFAKHNLSARTPAPLAHVPSDTWELVHERHPHAIGQMLWSVTGDRACRMQGGVAPCDPAAVLRKAVGTGAAYGMPLLEIYGVDIRNPALDDVIDEALRLVR